MGKGMVRSLVAFSCALLLLTAAGLYGANAGDVVINEIAWMGTAASSTDEWLELYNNTSSAIDLTDWTLSAEDGSPAITLSGIIPGGGYFLMERTNDEPVNDVTADFIYIGSLSNTVEHLVLRDAGGNVIDDVDPGEEWFAGAASPDYKSMERVSPTAAGSDAGNWGSNTGSRINGTDIEGNPIQGTPGAENSVYDASLSVSLGGFSATLADAGVRLSWTTESEVDTRGFFVSRSKEREGLYNRIHTEPIPARGCGSFGARYTYWDYEAPPNRESWYHLEEVDVTGNLISLGKLRVRPDEAAGFPESHRLAGCYPNPFNPVTTLVYQLGEDIEGIVDLTVYTLTGRLVRQLVHREQSPGHHEIRWFGKDEAGIEVPSGIYLARLTVGSGPVATTKLVKSE